MTVYYWARWLADALRADPWLAPRVIEVDGWRDRGRPPTQFAFLPTGVVEHHTACMARIGHDPQACLNGILAGNTDAPGPISQLLGTFTPPGVRWTGANADPRILIVAAGRSNHAGAGSYPWGAPSGNGASLGIEWCGPPADGWPEVVVECRERVTAAILRWNGWGPHQVTTHAEYAPTRKIDPSGRWRSEPLLAQLTRWTPRLWRDAVAGELVESQPPARKGVVDMYQIALRMDAGTLVCRVTAKEIVHEINGVAEQVDKRAGVHQEPVTRAEFLGMLAGGRRAVGDPFRGVWFDRELAEAWAAARKVAV